MVDAFNEEIKTYIMRLSEQALNREESRREMMVLTFANDVETIGDIVDKNLMELAKKRLKLQVEFSREGWVDLEDVFGRVQSNFEMAVAVFASRDRKLARELVRRNQQLGELESELRNRHFHRLHEGLTESAETSAIHLDILTNLKHINTHLTAVAEAVPKNIQA